MKFTPLRSYERVSVGSGKHGNASMATIDKFIVNLKCPQCGREGEAHLTEADGMAYLKGDRSTHVRGLSDGFKAVGRASRVGTVDIVCAQCDVSALEQKASSGPAIRPKSPS